MLALTIEQARSLVARISAVIEERDRLRREVEGLRLIMSELEGLRDLLENDASGAVTAAARSNGHFGAAVRNADIGTAASLQGAADEAILEIENATEASVHTPGCEPRTPPETTAADRHQRNASDGVSGADEADDCLEQTAGEPSTDSDRGTLPPMVGHTKRHDVLSARDIQNEKLPVDDDCPGEPKASERHDGQASAGIGSDTTTARPPEGSLMLRILEFLEASSAPRRPWQIQRGLALSRTPSAELSRLVSMGCLERPREGVYIVTGRRYDRASIDGY